MWDDIVSAATPDGKLVLWGLGGPSVVLRTTQTTILVDPFLGQGVKKGWERAIPIPFSPESIHSVDAVLSSHHPRGPMAIGPRHVLHPTRPVRRFTSSADRGR